MHCILVYRCTYRVAFLSPGSTFPYYWCLSTHPCHRGSIKLTRYAGDTSWYFWYASAFLGGVGRIEEKQKLVQNYNSRYVGLYQYLPKWGRPNNNMLVWPCVGKPSETLPSEKKLHCTASWCVKIRLHKYNYLVAQQNLEAGIEAWK